MHSESDLLSKTNLHFLPQSLTFHAGIELGLSRENEVLKLVLMLDASDARISAFEGDKSLVGNKMLLVAPLNSVNAAGLRTLLPWLQPRLLGLRTSAGLGDRLGLATPGHVRAVRKTGSFVLRYLPSNPCGKWNAPDEPLNR